MAAVIFLIMPRILRLAAPIRAHIYVVLLSRSACLSIMHCFTPLISDEASHSMYSTCEEYDDDDYDDDYDDEDEEEDDDDYDPSLSPFPCMPPHYGCASKGGKSHYSGMSGDLMK